LNDLEDTVKQKKDAISKSELDKTKLEHEQQTLLKEKTSITKSIAALEQQYPWIPEEKQYV
jgi:structural maintenance of chromosome 2